MNPDEDVTSMTQDELIAEVVRLRQGIRRHRDSSGHDLCWYHPELWNLLPDVIVPKPDIPTTPEFLTRCAQYRASLNRTR